MADTAHQAGQSESTGGNFFAVSIVTPSGSRAEYNVRHVRAPGVNGEFGVLAGHLPFLTALKMGAIVLDSDKGRKIWSLTTGFAEVLPDHVNILAERAEPAETIDLARAQAARDRAMNRLNSLKEGSNIDADRAKSALARALNRIRIVSGEYNNG